jgi:hypothetical protein
MPLIYTTNLGRLNKFRDDLALRARRRIFDIFMRECRPTAASRVADFGVSGQRSHPAHYFFEAMYPHRQNLTAIGRANEQAAWLLQEFPGLHFLEADLRTIPLPDFYFDYGICNAVVEHAGARDQQKRLVHEVCRVCRCVMFTTPNRWFPADVHTMVPFLHWLPDRAYRTVLKELGLHYFANLDNLNLLDRKSFEELFPRDRGNHMRHFGPRALPTNLICISIAVAR